LIEISITGKINYNDLISNELKIIKMKRLKEIKRD